MKTKACPELCHSAMSSRPNGRRGFTLLELIVVIAIIALLSALAVVSLSNIREKGRDTKRLSDMEALKTAMEMVKNEHAAYSEVGCEINTPLHSCNSEKLEQFLAAVENLKDPVGTVPCTAESVTVCDYNFSFLGETDYLVYFFLEEGAGNFADKGLYRLTPNGVESVQ